MKDMAIGGANRERPSSTTPANWFGTGMSQPIGLLSEPSRRFNLHVHAVSDAMKRGKAMDGEDGRRGSALRSGPSSRAEAGIT